MRKVKRIYLFTLIGFFLLFGGLILSKSFHAHHQSVYDSLLRQLVSPQEDSPLIIITLDDISLKWMQQKWPWHRGIYAQLLQKIYSYGPKVIGIDLIFSEKGSPEEDKTLQETLKKAPIPVILAQNFYFQDSMEKINGQKVAFSQESLDSPVFQAEYGFINIPQDIDGIIRRFFTYQLYNGIRYRSFPLAIAEAASNEPLLPAQELFIAYQGPAKTFPQVSFYEVFQNEAAPALFKDKIVLLGPTFTATNDFHLTPYSSVTGIKTAGIEVFANAIYTLLHKITLYHTPGMIYFFLALLISLVFLWAFFTQKNRFFIIIFSSGLLLTFFLSTYLLFIHVRVFFFDFSLLLFLLLMPALYIFFSQWAKILKLETGVNSADNIQIQPTFFNRFQITKREKDIIQLIANGLSNPEISQKLFVSLSTVKKHINHIYEKVGCATREELLELLQEIH